MTADCERILQLQGGVSHLSPKTISLTNNLCSHVTFACWCFRKISRFFLWSQISFGPACTACDKLRTCKNLDGVLMWTRLRGCWLWFHRTEVIIICIRHNALAGKAWCLNKHLEIICVYLSLLFFAIRSSGSSGRGGGSGLVFCCLGIIAVINSDCSSPWNPTIQTSQ